MNDIYDLEIHEELTPKAKPSKKPKGKKPKHLRIFFLYAFFVFTVLIFLFSILNTIFTSRNLPNMQRTKTFPPLRGAIYSKDHITIANSERFYRASVYPSYIDEEKKDFFAKLFSIHGGSTQSEIRKKLDTNKYTVLSNDLNAKQAYDIKDLSSEMLNMGVFKGKKIGNKIIYQGIYVQESGERRVYSFGSSFEPIIGYVNSETYKLTKIEGKQGIEKYYNSSLSSSIDGKMYGDRDVNSYVIFNKNNSLHHYQNGFDLILNQNIKIQSAIEKILEIYKAKLQAQEIIACVMESKTGKIVAMATSNKFNPSRITKEDYPSLGASFVESIFEPGSVIKPIILAKILEDKIFSPSDMIRANNGSFKMSKSAVPITDMSPYVRLSVEDAIIYSSNIVMSKLGLKLKGEDYLSYLNHIGLGRISGIDLPNEAKGNLPSLTQLNTDRYKASVAYGYGLSVNFMQLMKIYNIFNNNGVSIETRIVDYIINSVHNKIATSTHLESLISSESANIVKNILIKTAQKGTAKSVNIRGLEVGAKTGTAHISKKGTYLKEYITSMFGFVNDSNSSYTIGVTTFRPRQSNHFASQTSGKVFKEILNSLLENNYLSFRADLHILSD